MKIRDTKARRVMIEEIKKVYSHPTADDIYVMVKKRVPRVSLGTIYRNLELLSENGSILKLDSAGNQRRYDGNVKNHYHFRCLRCGQVLDIPVKPLEALEVLMPEELGFEIKGHRLEFQGLCPSCKSISERRHEAPGEAMVETLKPEGKEKAKWS